MGIIKKQSFQSTVFIYIGVIIGFINSSILFPYLFTPEEVGLMGFLNSLTVIFSTVLTFGVPLIILKMFPHFQEEENNHNGFFAFVLIMSLVSIVVGIAAYYLLQDELISTRNSARNFIYFNILFSLVFASRVIFKNIDSYRQMEYKTVLGVFLENVGTRILVLASIVAFMVLDDVSFEWFVVIYAIALASSGVFSLLLAFRSRVSFRFSDFKKRIKKHKKELINVGLFGVLGTLGTVLVLEIDRIMISNILGLRDNGIYTIAFYFAMFVGIPARGVRRVSAVVLSNSWKENDLENISDIYRKSCLNQLIISGYLFLGIWFCVPYVYQFLSPEYASGLSVILIVGIAQIIDLSTGVNTEIIVTSKYYRYNVYFTLVLIGLVIGLNYALIPTWGINGAAIASALSIFANNLMRYLFLYRKFGFQPFTFPMLWTVLVFSVVFVGMSFIPSTNNPIVGILLMGGLATLAFWTPVFAFRLSDDINDTVSSILRKITKK